MGFIGRYQLGEEVPLRVLTVDASRAAVAPTEAPTVVIYAGTTKAFTFPIPAMDQAAQTGYFSHRLFLGAGYNTGLYQVVYRWRSGSYNGLETDSFEIYPGGDTGGAVIHMTEYQLPGVDYIVHQLDGAGLPSSLQKGKNPRY